MSDVTATTTAEQQPTLQTLVQKLQALRARPWIEFVDLESLRWEVSLDLLLGLADAVLALQSATPAAGAPNLTQVQVHDMVEAAISAAFGRLESAVSATQPSSDTTSTAA
jgi:hypothetical protein